MNAHERQYFQVLLSMAVDRFSQRLIQRNQGVDGALDKLRRDPQGDGVWLDEFVDAFFRDALLDNPAGACFVLNALANRPLSPGESLDGIGTVGELVQRLAVRQFADLLRQKTEEALEQAAMFGG